MDLTTKSMIRVAVTVIVLAALHFAQSIFAPLAFAILIIALIWPIQKNVQRAIPMLAALALTISATIVIFVAFGWTIAWGVTRVARNVIGDAALYQAIYVETAAWLEGHGIIASEVWTEYFNVGRLLRIVQDISGRLSTTISFSVIVLVFVILGLLEVEDFAERLRRIGGFTASKTLLEGGSRTAEKLRSYMLVRTVMSIMTGLLVWGFLTLLGLPLAAEWGVIAFALNYIPFIGPFIATIFPTVFAMAHLPSWQMVLVVFAGLNLIQFLVGSYLEPRYAGSALSISPFVVLFSVFFWSFLWGLPGAFIGVPIVISLITLSDQNSSSRWISDIFGGDSAPSRSLNRQ